MAGQNSVAGDREVYYVIDGKLLELKRQLRQKGGYPFDLTLLERSLQNLIEGRFPQLAGGTSSVVFSPGVCEKVFALLDLSSEVLKHLWVPPVAGFWDVYAPKVVTPDRVIAAMRRAGITVWTWTGGTVDECIAHNDRDPGSGAYRVRFLANVEADPEFAKRSANDLAELGYRGITLTERLLLELAFFLATKENNDDLNQRHLDGKNVTLCAGSRDSGGDVPRVYWHSTGRGVYVDWCSVDYASLDLRSRLAVEYTCN